MLAECLLYEFALLIGYRASQLRQAWRWLCLKRFFVATNHASKLFYCVECSGLGGGGGGGGGRGRGGKGEREREGGGVGRWGGEGSGRRGGEGGEEGGVPVRFSAWGPQDHSLALIQPASGKLSRTNILGAVFSISGCCLPHR